MYCGKYADEDELIYIAYNMHWMEHTFWHFQALPGGYRWNVALIRVRALERGQMASVAGQQTGTGIVKDGNRVDWKEA